MLALLARGASALRASASDGLIGASRTATKMSGGTTKNGRDSNPKYLGLKKHGGEACLAGNIIIRQRGTKVHPGVHVGMGRDHTLFALKPGYVCFSTDAFRDRKYVNIFPTRDNPFKEKKELRKQLLKGPALVKRVVK
ncbi:ribosomal L27 protein-domain-containing protein [Pavlovales sp. CCMP2436]|nr:ribosomal L27 protein-domain-containing protein [Pavlovales sp. CCMP2436]